jgi:hypothetical protein
MRMLMIIICFISSRISCISIVMECKYDINQTFNFVQGRVIREKRAQNRRLQVLKLCQVLQLHPS